MSEGMLRRHITSEEIADYFGGLLAEAQESFVDNHLAECDSCVNLARRYHVFNEVWGNWNSETHVQAFLHSHVVHALEVIWHRSAGVQWKGRLENWLKQWAGKAEGAVRVILGAPGEDSRLVTEGMGTLLREGASWQFTSAPVRLHGSVSTRGRVAQSTAEAAGALPFPGETVAIKRGMPDVQVSLSAESREVSVRVQDVPPGQLLPLVLLLPLGEGREPRLEAIREEPGLSCSVARFEQVEPGEYLLEFEPIGRLVA
jgi:hypothetical protein